MNKTLSVILVSASLLSACSMQSREAFVRGMGYAGAYQQMYRPIYQPTQPVRCQLAPQGGFGGGAGNSVTCY